MCYAAADSVIKSCRKYAHYDFLVVTLEDVIHSGGTCWKCPEVSVQL